MPAPEAQRERARGDTACRHRRGQIYIYFHLENGLVTNPNFFGAVEVCHSSFFRDINAPKQCSPLNGGVICVEPWGGSGEKEEALSWVSAGSSRQNWFGGEVTAVFFFRSHNFTSGTFRIRVVLEPSVCGPGAV